MAEFHQQSSVNPTITIAPKFGKLLVGGYCSHTPKIFGLDEIVLLEIIFVGDCCSMMWKIRHFCFAIWLYLNQPLEGNETQSIWQVSRFWYLYKIQFLETCLNKDINSESHYTQ